MSIMLDDFRSCRLSLSGVSYFEDILEADEESAMMTRKQAPPSLPIANSTQRSESTKAKTMMPEGPKANGRIQTNGGSHEVDMVDMVGVCEAKGYLPSPDANQNRHQLQTSNGMSAMSTEQDDEGDIVLRCKSEHGTVDTDGDSYAVSAEIVGGRYPWQQDVMTQCGRKGTRNVSIQTELTEVCERCYTERVVKGDNSSSILNRVFRRSKLSKSQSSEFKPIGNDLSFLPASRHASISVPSTGRPLVDIRGIHDSRDPMGLSMPNINTADSLTPSPFPSPLPSPDVAKKQIGRDVDSANPTVVLSYHPDDSDSLSGINAGSHDDSSGSVTSNGSSLRVPSPELLQTIKTSYPKHLKIEPEEQGEDEETVPPPSYRRQRRDAVISQVAPSAQDMGSEEHELNNYKPDSPPQATRNSTTPQMDFLVPTVSRKQSNEHRASIMSEASFTLQSVAAKHVQGFIESSVQGLDNHVASEEVQDSKKKIAAMLRKKFGKQEKSGMGAIISNFKRHDQDELEYAIFKDKHWKDFIESGLGRPIDTSSINSEEYKRREKVWEVFRSECAYLVDHILVLKEIFQERLRWLQCEDHLMHIEIVKLFANVDELCTVSANLCWDLVNNLSSRLSEGEFGQADAIVAAFATFESQVCPAFSSYCMNYSGALLYLESLKKQDDFNEFCKICEQDSRCKRLQLTDLLITPIQRITKYTLLLRDIRKCTSQTSEKELLDSTITSVESAIGDLEGKVEWLANFERVRELQQMISWPPVEEIDSKLSGLVPDFLKSTIAKKSRDVVWFNTKRSLTHEGHLQVFENGRLQDVYVFLFDDMLLITRMRRTSFNKKKSLTDNSSPFGQNQNSVPKHRDGYNFTVCKPPFPLDRLEIVDVDAKQAMANGIKHCFVLVQLNRYGQVHTLFALSAPSEAKQQTWLGHLRESKTKWIRTLRGDSKSKDDKDRKKTP
nr:uncharacterized protein LOC129257555 [Lytechinus pictus]